MMDEGKATAQHAQLLREHIGKKLYNNIGQCAGTIIAVVEFAGIWCFEVDHSEVGNIGRYWQIARLNNGQKDEITVRE